MNSTYEKETFSKTGRQCTKQNGTRIEKSELVDRSIPIGARHSFLLNKFLMHFLVELKEN